MLIKTLKILFKRDLQRLKNEIEQYRSEEAIWRVDKEIINSGGNLCLHLIGNLNAFIGAELGRSGYIRQRTQEFSLKNIPRLELIDQVSATIQMIDSTLDKIKPEELEKDYPIIVFKEKMSTGFFLMHLATHLSYHLGQVNYHRRLLDH